MTMQQDLETRSHDIRWPAGFSPDEADMFSTNRLQIAASPDRVWRDLLAVTRWPDWYSNGRDVVILSGLGDDGRLRSDTVFRWETFGQRWETRIGEFDAPHQIGWYGYPIGGEPIAYHAWLLQPRDGGCLVITEEVGKGEGARTLRRTDEGAMNRGHDLWLAALRFVSEGPEQ